MTRGYLGLGANLGNRAGNIRKALAVLEESSVHIVRVSSFYETEPVGFVDQPWYLNLVAEIETDLNAYDLLHACQQVEQELGRERSVVNGPRTIDVDILLYGSLVIQSDELTVPHPRLYERRFTLASLAELDPETFSAPLAQIHGQPVRILRFNT